MVGTSPIYEIGKVKALIFTVVGIVLLIVSVMLLLQNRKLKAELMASAVARVKAQEIRLGAKVPPFMGIDINGSKASLSYGQDRRKTVLMLFSPGCGACKADTSKWQAILKSLDHNAFRAVIASTSAASAGEYAIEHGASIIVSATAPQI